MLPAGAPDHQGEHRDDPPGGEAYLRRTEFPPSMILLIMTATA